MPISLPLRGRVKVAERFSPPPLAGEGQGGGRRRVLIVGAGFGGLACAKKLDGEPVDVILVDQHNYHLFTPLLYHLSPEPCKPSDMSYPLLTVLRRSSNVRFRQSTVTRVELSNKVVRLDGAPPLAYDYLVLATGSTDNYFGNQELARVSFGLKSLEDATRLRNQVLTSLERADAEPDPEARRALLTFVIVGGGPTGVESSGALIELMEIVAGNDYHQISRAEIQVILVEGADRLLNAFSLRLGRYAQRVLTKRGVAVRTGALVKNANGHSVTLSDGTAIACATIIWSAGVRPNDPVGEAPLPRFRNARIEVDPWMRIPGAPGAFAIGDAASPRVGDRELPMLSPPAMQAGRYVARRIAGAVRGVADEGEPFHYIEKGTMANIGRTAGAAPLPRGAEFTGFLGWLHWIFVHIDYLIGFRNRISALASWAWDYVRHDRPIRIILAAGSAPKRV